MPFREFRPTPAVCAMIHVEALPGTPHSRKTMHQIVEKARAEARIFAEAGVDALMIENMHDTPYLRGSVGPEIVAAMTAVGLGVKEASPNLPLGVQILAGANREALACALACRADFVRVEGFVFAHVGDEGMHEACAGELLRYRRTVGAEHIAVLADIKKKHSSHAITADVSLEETAHAAEFFGADGVIVTGAHTGAAASAEDLASAKKATRLPVAIGSGITPENAEEFAAADLLIVGSSLKEEGHWDRRVDPGRVARLMESVRSFRRPL